MNDLEFKEFEQKLREARPAQPPAGFFTRLRAARPAARESGIPITRPTEVRLPREHADLSSWLGFLRWLVPATAVFLAAGLLWLSQRHHIPKPSATPPPPIGIKADEVKIDQELVSTFDAVARLPEGEPVRFRYREWVDDVVLRDKARGLVIHQRTPRVEVVPVRFETY